MKLSDVTKGNVKSRRKENFSLSFVYHFINFCRERMKASRLHIIRKNIEVGRVFVMQCQIEKGRMLGKCENDILPKMSSVEKNFFLSTVEAFMFQ